MAKVRPQQASAFKKATDEISAIQEIIKNKDSITQIPLDLIYSPRTHDRKCFDEAEIKELAENIKKVGLLQPIIVRRVGGKFERLVGFKRILATKYNNETEIKAIVLENITDEQAALITISENLFRSNPNIYDQTLAFLDYASISLKIEIDVIIKLLNKYKAGRELNEDEANIIDALENIISQNLVIKLRTLADRVKVLSINSLLVEAIQKRELAYQVAVLIDNNLKDNDAIKEMIEKVIDENLAYEQVKQLLKQEKTTDNSSLPKGGQFLPKKYKKVYAKLSIEKQKQIEEYLLKIEEMLESKK